MQSDGGLTPITDFSGHKAILSGPAGGVIGYATTTYEEFGGQPVVGFDMGGTSTGRLQFTDGCFAIIDGALMVPVHCRCVPLRRDSGARV